MRPLLVVAAFGLAAVGLHAASASTTHPETVFTREHGRIAAFAQDGSLVAWFAPSTKRCNTVHVLSLSNGLQAVLPQQGAARNVTCPWPVESTPVTLALASRLSGTFVVWTLREQSPVPFDYLIGATITNPREHRFQEFAHTQRGAGLWLGGIAGDRNTLAYAVTSVDYIDEAGCLAGTGTCKLAVSGGGVYRVTGGGKPVLVPGTGKNGVLQVASSDGALAYVRTAGVDEQGRPVSGPDLPIEVVDATTGTPLNHVVPHGTPLSLALTPTYLATFERTANGPRIAWYSRDATDPSGGGSVPISAKATPQISAGDRWIVYRVGRSIRGVDTATGKVRVLAHAAADPVGLSLDGSRLAWAENLGGWARIRALYLTR